MLSCKLRREQLGKEKQRQTNRQTDRQSDKETERQTAIEGMIKRSVINYYTDHI